MRRRSDIYTLEIVAGKSASGFGIPTLRSTPPHACTKEFFLHSSQVYHVTVDCALHDYANGISVQWYIH